MLIFLDLPPVALRLIFLFLDEESPPLLLLNKTTLPSVLAAVYSNAQLKGRKHIANFAASVIQRPSLLELVRSFRVSDPERNDGYWQSISMGAGAGQLSTENENYTPSQVVVRIGLLEELVFRMKKVTALTIASAPFYPLLSADFLALNPFPNIRSLCVLVWKEEAVTPPQGLALLGRLSALPNLTAIAISFVEGAARIPISALNLAPSTHIEPGSLGVSDVQIHGTYVDEGARVLFSSLGDSCTRLLLDVDKLSPSFMRDFFLLPHTLVGLSIYEGDFCDGDS